VRLVGAAEVRLDLSEVREADADAVHLLAQLAPEEFDRLACRIRLVQRLEMQRPLLDTAAVGSVGRHGVRGGWR
jgi:hypothetical protein